jgi:hypothetical protein
MSTTLLAVMAASALASSGASVETRSAQAMPVARAALVSSAAKAKVGTCFVTTGKAAAKAGKCADAYRAGGDDAPRIKPDNHHFPAPDIINDILTPFVVAVPAAYLGSELAKS